MVAAFPTAVPIACETEAEWLAARRSFVGASESATILGVGYRESSPAGIWESKAFGAIGPPPAPELKLRIGKAKEPLLRELFEEATGKHCEPPAAMAYRHKEFPFIGCSLDGEAIVDGARATVELKNVGAHNRKEWEGPAAPLKYSVQVQHQLLVTGAEIGYLFALVADEETYVFPVYPDKEFHAALRERLEAFWRSVETKTMPPLDESEATGRMLARLYPQDTGEMIDLPPEAAAWVAAKEIASADRKRAEAEITAADNLLKAALGSATYGLLPDGRRVSWKSQSVKSYVVEAREQRVLRISKS